MPSAFERITPEGPRTDPAGEQFGVEFLRREAERSRRCRSPSWRRRKAHCQGFRDLRLEPVEAPACGRVAAPDDLRVAGRAGEAGTAKLTIGRFFEFE